MGQSRALWSPSLPLLLPFPPGVKYPLGWVQAVQARSTPQHRHMVLLDAAAYTPTNPLDLKRTPADFVVGVLSVRG